VSFSKGFFGLPHTYGNIYFSTAAYSSISTLCCIFTLMATVKKVRKKRKLTKKNVELLPGMQLNSEIIKSKAETDDLPKMTDRSFQSKKALTEAEIIFTTKLFRLKCDMIQHNSLPNLVVPNSSIRIPGVKTIPAGTLATFIKKEVVKERISVTKIAEVTRYLFLVADGTYRIHRLDMLEPFFNQ